MNEETREPMSEGSFNYTSGKKVSLEKPKLEKSIMNEETREPMSEGSFNYTSGEEVSLEKPELEKNVMDEEVRESIGKEDFKHITEEKRRFKIEKRTSYEEQIKGKDKEITNNTFWLGLAALCATLNFIVINDTSMHPLFINYNMLLAPINAGVVIYNLKELIRVLSNKTMLKGKIEDINMELEMPEAEESKGMRK